MFTGIIEETGELISREGDRYRFAAQRVLDDSQLGDSIAVNGCCLTVVTQGDGWWEADISAETRRRTTLDGMSTGTKINLERPVRPTDRLGGHIVQGHVDAIGEVAEAGADLRVRVPDRLLRYLVEKGSVAVDGVSLTVASLFDDGFSVALIPHTMAVTNLGSLVPGDSVNLEVDVMAKYAERLLMHLSPPS